MMKYRFYIVRSARLKIDHNLMAKKGVSLKDIREIYSHEQAINQCGAFLKSLPGLKITSCENTAVAARMVADSPRNDVAASPPVLRRPLRTGVPGRFRTG